MKTSTEKLEYIKQWQKQNWSKVLEYKRRWRTSNPDHMQQCRDSWRSHNKDRIRKAKNSNRNRRLLLDAQYRIEQRLRSRVNRWLFSGFGTGGVACKCDVLVGCDKRTLRRHLHNQFKLGMDWNNHGPNGWHIHHITPCCEFDLTKTYQQRLCFHYSNMMPLWKREHVELHRKR